jgi:hypothetical protein
VANVKRIKHLMKQLGMEELKKAKLRFSIVSLKQLKAIYKNYTKEELAYIELLMNNKESIHPLVILVEREIFIKKKRKRFFQLHLRSV